MAGPIFINYRRGENLRDAQHLATLLARRFGDKRIFLDVRGIDGGEQWLPALGKQVAASDIMVALIGKTWIDLKDDEGNRRLNNANDFVRFEIAQALQRNIPVLPVLLDGAPMPKINELPHDMMALTLFQGMPLRVESVVQDAEAIARRLKIMLDQRRRRGVPGWAVGLGAAVLLMIGAAAGPFLINQLGLPYLGVLLPSVFQERLKVERDLASAEQDRIALSSRLAAALRERDQARDDFATADSKAADLQRKIDAATSELAWTRLEAERARSAIAIALRERNQARSDLEIANTQIADLQKQQDAANEPSPVKPRLQIQPRISISPPRNTSLGLTVSEITDELRQRYMIDSNVRGVVIVGVDAGSLAAEKGLRAGEVIIKVSAQEVATIFAVIERIDQLKKEGRKTVLLLVVNARREERLVGLAL